MALINELTFKFKFNPPLSTDMHRFMPHFYYTYRRLFFNIYNMFIQIYNIFIQILINKQY